MSRCRFDGRVAVITGAGGGLGKAYALLLASRGCAVLINDLGGSREGEGASSRAADAVVHEIRSTGGTAVANYDSVESGDKIVAHALREFGRLDILVNNAGYSASSGGDLTRSILRDRSFSKMSDQDWDLVLRVHLHGAFQVTKAAWPVFQRQNYGRILMTTSAAGLYGNYGQANYGAAKMALVGFGQTLAREGAKKNILCNIIAPVAGSRITETVLPADLVENLKPDLVAPFVAYLCHDSSTENGSIYEVGAGFAAKVRLERAPGALLKVDDPTFTPAAIAAALPAATLFGQHAKHPASMAEVDWTGLLVRAKAAPPNKQAAPLRFEGKVVLVTGAGGGLGRGYALMFGRLGGKVLVNDLGRDKDGARLADLVVEQIRSAGGHAAPNYDSVEHGQAIVDATIAAFGRIDVVVNNAGILRDKSFAKMTAAEWDLVLAVHLHGTYKVTKAAWPHMVAQKYGRIVNTASAVGLYGNFGQANYSAAKAGILGLSGSLAVEGRRSGILVNTIAPNAGTQMTATILPQDIVDALKPEYVAPLVGFLCHESSQLSGTVFEVGSGWFSQVHWQRSAGHRLDTAAAVEIEQVAAAWPKFGDFSSGATYPKSAQESFSSIVALLAGRPAVDPARPQDSSFVYGKRDVILYNIGAGCTEKDSKYVFEGSADFCAVPTFAVIPAFILMMNTKIQQYVEGFNPALLLHGEHYLEVSKPFPVEGKLSSERKVVGVLRKGKGCVVVIQLRTLDETGALVAINEGTIFIRNATPKEPSQVAAGQPRQPLALESPTVPDRKPDATIQQKIPDNQAAVYRLSGDYNPLHIDTAFAQMGGFPKPILHGLCTYGHAARHVIKAFAGDDPRRFKAIKARFTKHVFPGETIQTEMWQASPTRILFQVRVVERDEIALAAAFVELHPAAGGHAPAQPQTAAAPGLSPAPEGKAKGLFAKYQKVYESLPASMREDQVKKVSGVFQFEIKDASGGVASYYIDLKNESGKIGDGKALRPDITIIVKDDDFAELASGKINGQQAFMKGQVQVRGNMMLAMKLDRVLKTLSTTIKSKI